MELIIGLLSGAIGGNAAGAVMKKFDQGTVVNALLGIVGGGLGATVLGAMGVGGGEGGMDIGAIISQVVGGGIGGGALLAIVGTIKNMMAK